MASFQIVYNNNFFLIRIDLGEVAVYGYDYDYTLASYKKAKGSFCELLAFVLINFFAEVALPSDHDLQLQ